MAQVLELALLGGMRMNLGERPLEDSLKSIKARALLCYLAVTKRTHSRQSIATLFWPQLPHADARRNLRGVLMNLRNSIRSHLHITNQSVAFSEDSEYALDVERFRAHLQFAPGLEPDPASLRDALALYRGDFLEDLYITQSPAFDQWVEGQRTQLRELAVGACRRLVSYYLSLEDYPSGIAVARRSLDLDPLSEEGWRQLLLLLALEGQRNLALSQYGILRQRLMDELGVPPSGETESLVEEIRAGGVGRLNRDMGRKRSAVPDSTGSASPIEGSAASELSPFVAGPPLVDPRHFFGRERELKRLFNMLKRLPLQNGAIIGPRRSGKTSLLHYLRTISGARAVRLRPGQRADWLPFPERYRWIFVDFQDPRLGGIEPLLRYLLTQMALPVPHQLDLADFLDLVADNLNRPTVILLDEIGVALQRYPELDDAFWESLRSLATNQVGGQLGFVLTGSESPDELAHHSGLGSPFFNIFGYTAELGPLSETAACELIASSPLPFSEEDTEWILGRSGRWPILLQILCRERLLALEDGEPPEEWRQDAVRQMAPFQRALKYDPA